MVLRVEVGRQNEGCKLYDKRCSMQDVRCREKQVGLNRSAAV